MLNARFLTFYETHGIEVKYRRNNERKQTSKQ